jgi:hypothetical protein
MFNIRSVGAKDVVGTTVGLHSNYLEMEMEFRGRTRSDDSDDIDIDMLTSTGVDTYVPEDATVP